MGLVAPDGTYPFHRGPCGASLDICAPLPDSWHPFFGKHHAPDAHHDARGAASGLFRTAWSKGLRERVIIVRHAIKNALIPVVTLIGLHFPLLVGGSVIIENIFALPGLGRLLLDALSDRDYPVVSGVNLLFATVVMGGNLLVDLIYPYLDPRVRYE